LVLYINGIKFHPTIIFFDNLINIFLNGKSYEFQTPLINLKSHQHNASGSVVSPMPGKIIQVAVSENEKVVKGQLLAIMEAMKMEHSIRAPNDGIVKKVFVKENDMLQKDKLLVEIDYN
jgi:3-methylcrotonyl-CoA carboxylase alpha subunit